MKIRMEPVLVIDDKHAILITDKDMEEFNAAVFDAIGMEMDKDKALGFMAEHIVIYYKGKMWGFSDTEVREEIYTTITLEGIENG